MPDRTPEGGEPTPPTSGAPEPRWGQYAPGGPQDRPAAGGPNPPAPAPTPGRPTGWGEPPAWGQYGSSGGPARPGQYGQYGDRPPPPGFGPGPWGGPAAAPRPGIIPLRPLGLGELLDGAFRAIRTNPRVMFGLSAVVVTCTALLQALVTWRIFGSIEATVVAGPAGADESLAEVEAALGDLVSQLGVALGAQTISAIVTTILSGLLIVSVSQSVIGRTASLGEVWESARGQLVRLLVVSLLVGLIALAPVLIWGAVLAGTLATEQWGLAVAVGVVGGIAALVGLAVLVTKTVLATPALMLERSGIGQALRRGWTLTRGVFWRVLGIYVLTTVLVSVVAGAISGSVSIFFQLAAASDPATIFSPAYIVATTLAQIVATTLTTPFTAAVIALLYIDVRMRTEGLDIELARAAEQDG